MDDRKDLSRLSLLSHGKKRQGPFLPWRISEAKPKSPDHRLPLPLLDGIGPCHGKGRLSRGGRALPGKARPGDDHREEHLHERGGIPIPGHSIADERGSFSKDHPVLEKIRQDREERNTVPRKEDTVEEDDKAEIPNKKALPPLFENVDEIKKAVIYSEIMNRKYF